MAGAGGSAGWRGCTLAIRCSCSSGLSSPPPTSASTWSARSPAVEIPPPAVHAQDGFTSVTSVGASVPALAASWTSGGSTLPSMVSTFVPNVEVRGCGSGIEASSSAGKELRVSPRRSKIRSWKACATGIPVTCSMISPSSTVLVWEYRKPSPGGIAGGCASPIASSSSGCQTRRRRPAVPAAGRAAAGGHGRPTPPGRVPRRRRTHGGAALRVEPYSGWSRTQGGAEGIRTPDPLDANEVRYRTAPQPLTCGQTTVPVPRAADGGDLGVGWCNGPPAGPATSSRAGRGRGPSLSR